VGEAVRRRFQVATEASAVIVRARSNVGHIEFATSALEGTIEIETGPEGVITSDGPSANVEVHMDTLASGNALYDAELRRRIDSRRYPRAVVRLRSADRVEGTDRYQLSGDITMHGVTRPATGTVSADFPATDRIVVTGEHVFDIRDFDLPAPATMMLKIYPDVRVQLHLEAHTEVP
jgi:polyisoprenoid-binding protein YceI